MQIPLFPLRTVLFPGGRLPLRIFEARYLDMVADCLRRQCGFGVVAIREGQETGRAARAYAVGTLARIADWDRGAGGLLEIEAHGEHRFRVLSAETRADQLQVAEVELLGADDAQLALPAAYARLAELLGELLPQVSPELAAVARPADAFWVSARLSELLPLPLALKQQLLELDDPLERLGILDRELRALRVE